MTRADKGLWRPGSVIARTYWTVRIEGAARALRPADVIEALDRDLPDLSKAAVYEAVGVLRQMGLFAPAEADRILRALDGEPVPWPVERAQARLVPLLQDCEAGVSLAALARDARMSRAEVVVALAPLVQRHEVRTIVIDRPPSLDGGPGYQWTPGQVQAREWTVAWDHPLGKGVASATPAAVLADARHMIAAQADAVVPAGQHRHALVGQHGAYAITASQRLQVSWGGDDGMRITLPPAVTRELLTWLGEAHEAMQAADEQKAA